MDRPQRAIPSLFLEEAIAESLYQIGMAMGVAQNLVDALLLDLDGGVALFLQRQPDACFRFEAPEMYEGEAKEERACKPVAGQLVQLHQQLGRRHYGTHPATLEGFAEPRQRLVIVLGQADPGLGFVDEKKQPFAMLSQGALQSTQNVNRIPTIESAHIDAIGLEPGHFVFDRQEQLVIEIVLCFTPLQIPEQGYGAGVLLPGQQPFQLSK